MFYTSKEVADLLKVSQSKAYQIIRDLIEEFKREFPDKYVVRARIPKWYLENKMGGIKNERNKRNDGNITSK